MLFKGKEKCCEIYDEGRAHSVPCKKTGVTLFDQILSVNNTLYSSDRHLVSGQLNNSIRHKNFKKNCEKICDYSK